MGVSGCWSAGGGDLGLDGGEAVLESVAWSVDGDDFAVVQEPVEDSGGQDLVAEHASPFREGFVAGQQGRALLIPFGDRLEASPPPHQHRNRHADQLCTFTCTWLCT